MLPAAAETISRPMRMDCITLVGFLRPGRHAMRVDCISRATRWVLMRVDCICGRTHWGADARGLHLRARAAIVDRSLRTW